MLRMNIRSRTFSSMQQAKFIWCALLWLCFAQAASSHSGKGFLLDRNFPGNNPAMFEEIIISRLEAMNCLVKPKIEEDVIDQVKRFIGRDRMRAMEILHRTETYFPLIDKVFSEYNLPKELKYLTIVESSLIINAKSRMGAAGLWQLMPSTAKILQLRVDEKIDQRLDPVLSTHAAAKYFKTLYEMFGDWSLVLAAYNSGEYRIKRLLQSTGKKDFWSLRASLPRQTQLFVPAFIGASYFVEYSEEHEMIPEIGVVENNRLTFAKIFREINLKDLYKKTAIKQDVFKQFNPGYKRSIIPAHSKGHFISLPDSLMVEFIDYYTYQNKKNRQMSAPELISDASDSLEAEIISFTRPEITYPDNIQVVSAQSVCLDYDWSLPTSEEMNIPDMENPPVYAYHILGFRESLASVAENNAVDLEDLLAWNEISHPEHTAPGTVLKIKVKP